MHKFKTFGVTVVSVLVLSAALASSAAALQHKAGSYPADVSGVQTNENVVSNGIRSITCSEASLTGQLVAASFWLDITPAYSNCTGNGSTTATISTFSCWFTLEPVFADATSGNDRVSIHCGPLFPIQIDIWATGKSHGAAKLCRLEIPSQLALGGIGHHVRTVGGKKVVDYSINLSSLKILRVEGTAVNCGAAEKTNGTYVGTIRFSAKNWSWEQTDFWID